MTHVTTTDDLLQRAVDRTNLSDFGPDGWQEGFEALVAAIPVDLGDNEDQVRRVEDIVVARLVNRLRIEGWYAEHGEEAAAHDIEGILMILGTGRSGTTAAHYLLAVDPQFRYLRKWETNDPVPPPVLGQEQDDPRRPTNVQSSAQHIATADGPTEDRKLYELTFREKGNVLGLPSYVKWWLDADHTDKFPHHERVLKLLQSHRPPHRWLLKSPEDTFNLVPLAAYYPDAKFVMTHRDPLKVVPSACSVTAMHTRERLPDWEPDDDYGRRILHEFHESVVRFMDSRGKIGGDRFLDVGQPDINGNPVGVAERVYEFAGLELAGDVRDAMARFGAENREGSSGAHKYTPEEFGLTDALIADTFADYIDEYERFWAKR
jgi:hypothetical protein